MSSVGRCAVGLLLLGAVAGCHETATTDLGAPWDPGDPECRAGGWMAWSADARTLFWVGRDAQQLTGVLCATTGADGPVSRSLPDTQSYPAPQLADGDRVVFFVRRQPGVDASILLRAPLADGVAGQPVEVARDVFSYLASPDGARVVVEASAAAGGGVTSIDVATGARVALATFHWPTVFSPSSRRLLMNNAGANDASEHYALVDPATGDSESVSFPQGDTIRTVVRWDGDRPRVVIGGWPRTIDLVSGEQVELGWNGFAAVSGDAAAIRHAYGWTSECRGPHSTPESDGHVLCQAIQLRLVRADVMTGATDVVAMAANDAPSIAISTDGRRLAAGVVATGALHVKELSAPR